MFSMYKFRHIGMNVLDNLWINEMAVHVYLEHTRFFQGPSGPNKTGISTGWFGHVKTFPNSVAAVHVVFESNECNTSHKLNCFGL